MLKQSLKNTDIVVSFRASTQERMDNLFTLLNYLDATFIDYRVLIVEGDVQSLLPLALLEDTRIKHIFVHATGAFPKSLLYNTGAKYAQSDVIIFHDSDLIINPEAFNVALNAVQKNSNLHVSPFYQVVNFSETAKKQFVQVPNYGYFKDFDLLDFNSEYKILSVGAVGGVNVLNRQKFMQMGGFNSNMIGWGSEDGEFYVRWQRAGLGWYAIDYVAFHLHHDVDHRDDLKLTKNAQSNLALELYTRTMPDEELAQLTNQLRGFF